VFIKTGKTYFDFTKVQVAKRIRYSCSL